LTAPAALRRAAADIVAAAVIVRLSAKGNAERTNRHIRQPRSGARGAR